MNIETTFHVLASPVRREILAVLRESNSVGRDELTERLATDDEATRHQMAVALHHNHLPKLADADLITYDGETVTATSRLQTVVHQFRVADADETTPTPA